MGGKKENGCQQKNFENGTAVEPKNLVHQKRLQGENITNLLYRMHIGSARGAAAKFSPARAIFAMKRLINPRKDATIIN